MNDIIPGYKLLPLLVEIKSSRWEEEKDCDIDINGSVTTDFFSKVRCKVKTPTDT